MICYQFEKAEIERVIIYQTNNNIRYKIHINFSSGTYSLYYWYQFGSKVTYKRIKSALYKALFLFYLYSNSILYTFKSIQHIHYMIIYTNISCIILYFKYFTYIMYSFWSHCEYILSTSILISCTITIKEWE